MASHTHTHTHTHKHTHTRTDAFTIATDVSVAGIDDALHHRHHIFDMVGDTDGEGGRNDTKGSHVWRSTSNQGGGKEEKG